jgi:hypothetical protein
MIAVNKHIAVETKNETLGATSYPIKKTTILKKEKKIWQID